MLKKAIFAPYYFLIMHETSQHKAGFIHLLGKPNVGKSTLFNRLIKTSLAITTPKAQTTRQTLIGIDNGADYQAIYVDTPGYITPSYPLQQAMMRDVTRSIPGSDLCCWVVDIKEEVQADFFPPSWKKVTFPCFLLINKRDLVDREKGEEIKKAWQAVVPSQMEVHLMSALCKADVKALARQWIDILPTHPPYYDREMLTDRPEKFVVAEMIRKALFLHYKQEIPYSTQVDISQFSERDGIVHIQATIYVERETQKRILIGKQGKDLKEVGIAARQEIERFLQQKVFLRTHVKVAPKWRHNPALLEKWGYT